MGGNSGLVTATRKGRGVQGCGKEGVAGGGLTSEGGGSLREYTTIVPWKAS